MDEGNAFILALVLPEMWDMYLEYVFRVAGTSSAGFLVPGGSSDVPRLSANLVHPTFLSW
jgi:hypothetical protein